MKHVGCWHRRNAHNFTKKINYFVVSALFCVCVCLGASVCWACGVFLVKREWTMWGYGACRCRCMDLLAQSRNAQLIFVIEFEFWKIETKKHKKPKSNRQKYRRRDALFAISCIVGAYRELAWRWQRRKLYGEKLCVSCLCAITWWNYFPPLFLHPVALTLSLRGSQTLSHTIACTYKLRRRFRFTNVNINVVFILINEIFREYQPECDVFSWENHQTEIWAQSNKIQSESKFLKRFFPSQRSKLLWKAPKKYKPILMLIEKLFFFWPKTYFWEYSSTFSEWNIFNWMNIFFQCDADRFFSLRNMETELFIEISEYNFPCKFRSFWGRSKSFLI